MPSFDKFRDPWRTSSAIAVAGVDYPNAPEDGGASRQGILAALPDEPFRVSLVRCTFVRDGVPEDAIKVKAYGRVIGYVPKELVPRYLDVHDMVAKTYKSKRRITCRLLPMARPTPAQARVVRQLMRDRVLASSPAWDRNAITWTLNQFAFEKA